MAAENTLDKIGVNKIGDFAYVTDGIHESIDFDENSDINLISAKAPKNNVFDLSSTGYISAMQNAANPRTQLKVNDVIVSTVGTIGNCAVVNEHILPSNADRHVGIIRINSDIKPHFLSTFILTKYGRYQTTRFTTGNVQPNLFIYKVKDIKVPLLSSEFQNIIENTVLKSEQLFLRSENTMKRSETLLNDYLSLTDIADNDCAVKTFSESFVKSGRLDAEYYQPKYERLLSQLNNCQPLHTLCKLYDGNYNPDLNTAYNYIELANVGNMGDIANIEKKQGVELPSRARRIVHNGQVIVSSIEGSLSSCALIDNEYDGALCSTGFYVVDSDIINSETLLVLFKSEPMQTLLQQRCSGTILTAISKEEFLNIPIPNIPYDLQKEISDKVQESFRLRKEAKRLLDNAIKAVEMAIETDEETAIAWLKSTNGVI